MSPTVETYDDAAEALPILVTVLDAAIEPDVTVAPAGRVRITLMNQGERPHDLVLVRDGHARSEAAADGSDVAGRVAVTGPGDSAEAVLDLAPGRYRLESCDMSDVGS